MATTFKFSPVVEKTGKVKVKVQAQQEQPVLFINGWAIPEMAFGPCSACQFGRHCYSGKCPCC
jgi:hypothetical protein